MKKDTKNIQDELNSLSPLLAELQSKDSGQKVPDGYFEQLESDVFRKIEAEGYRREVTASGGSTPVWSGLTALRGSRLAMAAVAVFVLVFGAWWFFRMQPGQPAVPHNYQELAAKLTAEDAAAYISSNIHEFETRTLENFVAVEQTTPPDATPERPRQRVRPLEDLSDEQLDLLLQDLSDEELEEIL